MMRILLPPIANMALYSHMPTVKYRFKSGSHFEDGVIPRFTAGKTTPSPDECRSEGRAKPLANGYRYMTLRGFEYRQHGSADLSLFAHWFGRRQKKCLIRHQSNGKAILDELPPLPEEARPSEYYVEESLWIRWLD